MAEMYPIRFRRWKLCKLWWKLVINCAR